MQNQSKHSATWTQVILFLIIFWPIGLFLLIKKLNSDRSATFVGGGIINIIGWILAILGSIGIIMLFQGGEMVSSGIIWFVLVGVPGIMLIIKGKKVKAKSLKYKKYIQLIVNQQITDISQLAIYTGKSASEVLDDLREMISSGNLGSAVLDPTGMGVVLRRPAHATQNQQQPAFATNQDQVQVKDQPIPTFTPTVVKCKACGADNFVDAPHANCEYCGSPL